MLKFDSPRYNTDAVIANSLRPIEWLIQEIKMGDKGGKKDKDKSKKQKNAKHEQQVKKAQDKPRPKMG
jgi:hypothetical protein